MLSGSFSIFKWPGTPTGPIEYLEIFVGTVQLVSCQNIVTLTGTILSDPTGHTYFWEQIEGPPVTWLEPQDQLTVTFQKPSLFNDLIFRLWIDRYTPYQQYKDIIVTNVARDDLVYSVRSVTSGASSTLFPGVSQSFIAPGPAPYGTTVINNTVRTLYWTNPVIALPSLYLKNEILLINGSSTTVVATLPFTVNQYTNASTGFPDINAVYIIRSYLDVLGVGQIYQQIDTRVPGTMFDTNSLTLDSSDLVIETQKNIQTSGVTNYFQTQIVNLENFNIDLDIVTQYATNIQTSGSGEYFQTQLVTLSNIPAILQDSITTYALNSNNAGRLTVFQVQISDGVTIIG